jgi:peptide subunit release factor 1 (eRF1)
VVVMPEQSPKNNREIYKGIVQERELIAAVEDLLSTHQSIWIETDMRAHLNPSRMAVIREAAEDLVQKIQQTCPECNWPGFQVTRRLPGLPCAGCGSPTTLIYSWVYTCQKCDYQQTVPFPEGLTKADPGQCAYCNP